ncbi:MAG TPA: hypothetical protein VGO01_22045 [Bradyrhizobium sp.]|jgi:hypothetical protein|nr:hypothetical protein [Bradyrhizobium sp.]
MTILVRSWIGATLLGCSMAIAICPGTAYAQGSAGGSIGNDDKAVSGSRPEPRAVEKPSRRSRSDDEPRRSSSRKSSGGGGGGGGGFDGAWIVNAVGVTCSGSSSNAVVVTSDRIIGNNVTSGRVSPNGSVYATGGSSGLTNVTTGRLSGRSGSGTFVQSDGCRGRWTASKQ